MKQLLAILLLLSSVAAVAQQKKNSKPRKETLSQSAKDTVQTTIRMIAQNYGDSIVVRWAPGDATAWLLMQKNGFMLRRTVFSRNQNNEFKVIDSSALRIRPWTIEQWGSYFKATSDTFGAMAAQLAYGKYTSLPNSKEGNSLNSILEKYDEQQNRFTFALLLADFNPQIADGFGFRYVERHIKKDLQYLFTVLPVAADVPIISDTGRALVRGAQPYQRDSISHAGVVQGDSVVHLFWMKNPLNRGGYSGYFIERSDDGKNFKRLNRLPFVPVAKPHPDNSPIQYTDSVHENYRKRYYRIIGINAFGDLSYPSRVLTAMGVDLSGPTAPVITEIKNPGGTSKIHLKWEKKLIEKDFSGYVVGRSNQLGGVYEPVNTELLSSKTNEFTDENPSEDLPNFYIVAAIDTAGNASKSIPAYVRLEDHTPPAKPSGLKGTIDSAGRVTIQWNMGKENDLAGYKLFFANAPDHSFSPLTGELYQDTLFADSIVLKTLTKKIYYKVIAYDLSMNPSAASDILVINKPDIVPPVKATIHGFLVSDSGVLMKWYQSSSADAASQLLFRKKDGEDGWTQIAKLQMYDSLYFDRSTLAGQKYQYCIETLDSSGLNSGKSFPLQVLTYQKGNQGEIRDFEGSFLPEKKIVSLKWKAPKGDINYYVLFREKDSDGLKMAGNIKGNAVSHTDDVSAGVYKYALKAVFNNGMESAVTELISIQVR